MSGVPRSPVLTQCPRSSMLVPTASRRGSQAQFVIVNKKRGTKDENIPTGALLADLMDRSGMGWYQVLILPSLLGMTVVEYGQVQMISSITLAVQLEWGFDDWQRAFLPSVAFFGLGVGTLISGLSSDTFGRQRTILHGYLATAVSSVCLVLASSYMQMACLVLVNGVACGIGVTAAMVMITELCPGSIRAVAFVLPLLAQAVGEIYAVTVIDIFMPDLRHGSWRSVVVIVALPTYFFLALCAFYLRESPYWLVVQGRVLDARAEILEIARVNGTLDRVEVLAETLESEAVSVAGSSTQAGKVEGAPALLRQALSSGRFMLVAGSFTFLCLVGQLLTFGMSYFWPLLLEGLDFDSPAVSLGLIRSFGIPSALLMIPIMRSDAGHRWIIGLAGAAEAVILSLISLALTSQALKALVPLAGLSLASANLFYCAALVFMTESYPTSVRAVMAALSVCVGRLGAFAGPDLLEMLGFQGFLAFASGMAVIALPLLMFLTETKGKQLEDFLLDDEGEASSNDEESTASEHVPLLAQQCAVNDDDTLSESSDADKKLPPV